MFGANEPRLTPKEIQALHYFCEGYSTREAAARMGISFKTAESHRIHIMRKAGVHNPIDLFRWGVSEGYVPPLLAKESTKMENGFAYECTACDPKIMGGASPMLVMFRCPKHGLCWHRRSKERIHDAAIVQDC
jgi:DNA-binding CsgD family transcriptional regulator